MPTTVVATRPGTSPLPAPTEGEKAEWLGVGLGEGPERGQGLEAAKAWETSSKSRVSAAQRGEGGEGKEWEESFSAPPFSSFPDAVLGDAGAGAEVWAAADPGRAPHPGRPALLSALPGARSRLCAGELAARACFLCPCFSLWPLGLGLY